MLHELQTINDRLRQQSFQPCDIADVFEEVKPEGYAFRTGVCYQICDNVLDTCIASGSPAVNINYEKNHNGMAVFTGQPEKAFVAKQRGVAIQTPDGTRTDLEATLYAIIFLEGIRVDYTWTEQSLRTKLNGREYPVAKAIIEAMDSDPQNPMWDKETVMSNFVWKSETPTILIARADVIIDGKIYRDTPRPFQIDGKYMPF